MLKGISAVKKSKLSGIASNTCRYIDSKTGVRCREVCKDAYCTKHKSAMPEHIKGLRGAKDLDTFHAKSFSKREFGGI